MSRANLREAFRTFRKNGYFARMNFWCCQTCGWSEVPDEKSDKVVFFHNQDNDTLKDNGYTYLAWAGDGNEIKTILEAHDIEVEWDGSDGTRIKANIW